MNNRTALSDYVPVSRAAKLCGVSPSTIKRRIADGTLAAVDISAPTSAQPTLRVSRDSLEALMRPVGRVDSPSLSTSEAALNLSEAVSRLTDEQARRIGEILRGVGA